MYGFFKWLDVVWPRVTSRGWISKSEPQNLVLFISTLALQQSRLCFPSVLYNRADYVFLLFYTTEPIMFSFCFIQQSRLCLPSVLYNNLGRGLCPLPRCWKFLNFAFRIWAFLERQKDNLNRFCITILSSFPQGITSLCRANSFDGIYQVARANLTSKSKILKFLMLATTISQKR